MMIITEKSVKNYLLNSVTLIVVLFTVINQQLTLLEAKKLDDCSQLVNCDSSPSTSNAGATLHSSETVVHPQRAVTDTNNINKARIIATNNARKEERNDDQMSKRPKRSVLEGEGMRFKKDSVLDEEGLRFKKDSLLDQEGMRFRKSVLDGEGMRFKKDQLLLGEGMRFKKDPLLNEEGMRFKKSSVLDGEGMRFKKGSLLDDEGMRFKKWFTRSSGSGHGNMGNNMFRISSRSVDDTSDERRDGGSSSDILEGEGMRFKKRSSNLRHSDTNTNNNNDNNNYYDYYDYNSDDNNSNSNSRKNNKLRAIYVLYSRQ